MSLNYQGTVVTKTVLGSGLLQFVLPTVVMRMRFADRVIQSLEYSSRIGVDKGLFFDVLFSNL